MNIDGDVEANTVLYLKISYPYLYWYLQKKN